MQSLKLAKCGVGNFTLVDRDRLFRGKRRPPSRRHFPSLAAAKSMSCRDLILEKNPDARVTVVSAEVTFETQEQMKKN